MYILLKFMKAIYNRLIETISCYRSNRNIAIRNFVLKLKDKVWNSCEKYLESKIATSKQYSLIGSLKIR